MFQMLRFMLILCYTFYVITYYFSSERLLFVNKFLIWETKILSVSIDSCISVSFGFPNDLGVSMFEVNLDDDEESWNRETIGSTDDCFLVFVGGNFIDMLDQVVEKVERIGKKLRSMAKAIIINSQQGQTRNIRDTWPPLVCIHIEKNVAKTSSSQVYFPNSFKTGFSFSLQCPGELINYIFELQLFNDGTAHAGHGNVHYYDVCKVVYHANIAYNAVIGLGIDKKTNEVIKEHTGTGLKFKPIKRQFCIPQQYEIIGGFITQNNINPTWISANKVFGYLDKETGKWTGEIGKVRMELIHKDIYFILSIRCKVVRQIGLFLMLTMGMEPRLIIKIRIIVKPKSSTKSKSQIQVPNPGPKSKSQIQNQKSREKGMGLGLTL